ncbi:MAG: mediator of RNA polymerase II transcription subunit 8 [Thelocarpon superellum]|nr:MAG: mediator of RNA polymerase II transcription subunit 8 [Thelocarpon superellum]
MAAPSPVDIKALEQTRQRLFQLTNSLASLQQNILNSPTLPPWTSLQSLSTIISHNLNALTTHLASAPGLFSSTVAYPLPNFPAAAEEALLVQLLRKKLEVGVEDWVLAGREAGRGEGEDGGSGDALAAEQFEELWAWAGPAANEEARARVWVEEEYTREERELGVENVVTGLKGRMGGGDSDEDEDDENDEHEDEEDEEDGPAAATREEEKEKVKVEAARETKLDPAQMANPTSIEDVLRFMSAGTAPGATTAPSGGLRR